MSNRLREAWLRYQDPVMLFLRAKWKLYSLWLSATYPFAAMGKDLSVHYPCMLDRRSACHIKVGNSIIIGKDTTLYVVRDAPTEVKLIIDDGCTIGARSVISARNLIHIERQSPLLFAGISTRTIE